MKWKGRVPLYAGLLATFLVLAGVGVFANGQILVNSGNTTTLGAGAAPILPCDNDLNVTPILLNNGSNVYVQGFQYDNVDKPGCVGFDFETHFVNNSNGPMQLFATSSISSDPSLVRVFAPTASANWQVGLGAQGSVEVTVTQLSASSFKVIFTTPISLASDLGNIVMAEMKHLPLANFTSGYTEIGATNGDWYATCLLSNSSRFYALDISTGLYQSSTIPAFPGSVSGVTTSLVSASAIPTSGVSWYSLACSSNGQYIIIGGTNNQISYSQDFGATWSSKSTSAYDQGSGTLAGMNNGVSMSDDGKVVALSSQGFTTAYFNFWVNGDFWTSSTSATDGKYAVSSSGVDAVAVSGDGSTIYGGGSTGSAGLYRFTTSSIPATGSKSSVSPTYTNSTFGTYIRSIACSSDGQSAVIASKTLGTLYVTRNRFSTWYTPSGMATTNQSRTIYPYIVSMSRSGQYIAVGFGDYSTSNTGTTQISTDYGNSLNNTAFTNRYMQAISISDDGSRYVTGGGGYAGSTKLVIMGSS